MALAVRIEVMEWLWSAITVVAFLALYQWLRIRAGRPPVQWRWLAAIALVVAVAIVAGAAGL